MIHAENLLCHVRLLADREFQETVWLGLVPDQMSSFVELVCEVFDDTGLGDAIADGVAETQLGRELVAVAIELKDAVDTVDQGAPVQVLVASESMEKVRGLAKRIVELLEGAAS